MGDVLDKLKATPGNIPTSSSISPNPCADNTCFLMDWQDIPLDARTEIVDEIRAEFAHQVRDQLILWPDDEMHRALREAPSSALFSTLNGLEGEVRVERID